MAEKTPSTTKIYLDTRRLLDEILDVTPNYPRYFKYSIGARSQEVCINLLHLIARAYLSHEISERINVLAQFQMEFETLRTLIRVAGERKWIKGNGRHSRIVELLDSIRKQSAAWKNSLVKAKE